METKQAPARSYYIIWGLALVVLLVLVVSTFRLMGLPPDPPGPGVEEPLDPLDTPREEIEQTPPPDRIESMPPGQEIEELDEQPFERPPGTTPADPRRPATVPEGAAPGGDGGARLEEEAGMGEDVQVRSVPEDLQRVEEDGEDYDDDEDHEDPQGQKEMSRAEIYEEEAWQEVEWEEADERARREASLEAEWEEPWLEEQGSEEAWRGDEGFEEQEAYQKYIVARESSEEAFAGYQDFLDESGIPDPGGAAVYSSMATQQAAEALYRLAMQGGSSLEMAARSHDEVMDAHDEEFADVEEADGSGQDESVEEEEEEVEASVWVKTADWLREIQEESFPDLGEMVSDVEDAAWAIDSEVPRSEQVDELVAFYSILEDTLEQMVGVELDPDLGI